MKRRWPRRLLLGVVLFIALLLGGATVLLHSAWVSNRIRAEVVQAVNGVVQGKLEVGQLQLDGDSLVLKQVKLFDAEGELVAQVDTLSATVELSVLASGKVHIKDARLTGGFVDLSRDAKGLKLARAVTPKELKAAVAEVKKTPSVDVRVDSLELSGVKLVALDANRDDALREFALEVHGKGSAHYSTPPGALEARLSLQGQTSMPQTDALSLDVDAKGPAAALAGSLKLTLGDDDLEGTFDLGKRSAQLLKLHLTPKWVRTFAPQVKLKSAVDLHGTLSPTEVTLDGEAAGTVHLDAALAGLGTETPTVPHLALTLGAFKPNELLEDVAELTVDAKVEGSLTDPKPATLSGTLTATAKLGTRGGPANVFIDAHATQGSLTLEPARVALPGAQLEVRGAARPQQLALDGTLKVDDLGQLARFGADVSGRPAVAMTGQGELAVHVKGSAQHPSVAAAGNFPAFSMDTTKLKAVAVTVTVPDVRRPRQGQLNLDIGEADFGEQHLERFDADVVVDDLALSGRITAQALEEMSLSFGGNLGAGFDSLDLSVLDLEYPGTEWKLATPGRLTWGNGDWHVDPLTLTEGPQSLSLHGEKKRNRLDAEVKLIAFDLKKLPQLLRKKLSPEGTVDLGLVAKGAPASPDVDFDLTVKGGKLGELSGLGLTTQGKLSKGRIGGTLKLISSAGTLEGTIDAALKWKEQHDALELEVKELDLGGVLDALHRPRQLEGHAAARVRFEGTLEAPKATVSLTAPSVVACALPGCMTDAPRLELSACSLTVDVEPAKPITVEAGVAVLDGNIHLQASSPATLAQLIENKNGGVKEAPLDATLIVNNLALVKLAEQGITDSVIDQKLALKAHLTGNALHPDLDAQLDTLGVPPGSSSKDAKDPKTPAPFLLSTHLDFRSNRQRIDVIGWGKLGASEVLKAKAQLDAPLEKIAVATEAPLLLDADLGPLELNSLLPKSNFVKTPPLGSVEGHLRLTGNAESPHGVFRADFKDLHYEKVNLGRLDAAWKYDDAKHVATVHWESPKGGTLDFKGGLNLDVGVAALRKGLQVHSAPFTAQLDALHFDLSAGSGLSTTVRKLGGILEARVTAQGQLDSPHANGHVEWVRGRLGSSYGDYTDVRLSAEGDETQLKLNKLYAKTGDGDVDVTALLKRTSAGFDVTADAKLKKMPVVSDDQLAAIVTADVHAAGSRSGNVTEIKLTLPDTHVELPDVKRKDLQDLSRPKDIVLVRGGKRLEKKKLTPEERAALNAKQKGERVALFIDAPKNIWVKSDDLNLELGLSDGFEVDLQNGAELFGEAHVNQGRIDVIGRRFDVQKDSMVRFQGPPETPYINLTANYTNDSEGVVVTVTVVGRGKDLTLKTSSQPQLSDNEIFALLATGRRTLKRGGGSSISAGQAASVIGAYAASQLKTMVAKKLPLDVLSIDTGDEGLASAKVEAGTYLSQHLYLGYQLQLGADKTKGQNEHSVRLEYQLSKSWTVEGSAGDAPAASGDVMWSHDY